MQVRWEKSFLFYPILLCFFCLDLYSYFIFGHNVFAAILILWALLLAKPLNVSRVIVLFFFLSLESFFFYGRSYLSMIYLIPIFIMIIKLRDKFWDPFTCVLATLIVALGGQFVILEYYLLDQPLFALNHLLGLIINIMLLLFMMIFS